jgi:hypothetical protein
MPDVTFPTSLTAIGYTDEMWKQRVKSTKAKNATAWQKELDDLASMASEFGAAAVLAAVEASTSGGYQGCTRDMVKKHAKTRSSSPQEFDPRW